MRVHRLLLSVCFVLTMFTIATVAQDDTEPMEADASTTLQNVDGMEVGMVTFSEQEDGIMVTADFTDLPEGFHGFHIHTTGSCEDSGEGPFTAAGGHLNPDGSNHPDHAGDLPTLLVMENGSAHLTVMTDRFTFDELFDEDGSAMIVHSNANNFANIPERYGSPDEETLNAGDSGDRIACGVVERGGMMSDSTEPTPSG